MVEETHHEFMMTTDASEFAIGLLTDLLFVPGRGIPKMLLDVPMAAFFGVQLRCVGWQPFHTDLGILSQVVLDLSGSVGAEPIPDHDERGSKSPSKRRLRCVR